MNIFYLFAICFFIYNWNYNTVALKKSLRIIVSDFISLLQAFESYLNSSTNYIILYLETGMDIYLGNESKFRIEI